jgi:hypothetical protein
MAIRENPKNENIILIGYETSHIVEWEITTRKAKIIYGPLKQVCKLLVSCLLISLDASLFILFMLALVYVGTNFV